MPTDQEKTSVVRGYAQSFYRRGGNGVTDVMVVSFSLRGDGTACQYMVY